LRAVAGSAFQTSRRCSQTNKNVQSCSSKPAPPRKPSSSSQRRASPRRCSVVEQWRWRGRMRVRVLGQAARGMCMQLLHAARLQSVSPSVCAATRVANHQRATPVSACTRLACTRMCIAHRLACTCVRMHMHIIIHIHVHAACAYSCAHGRSVFTRSFGPRVAVPAFASLERPWVPVYLSRWPACAKQAWYAIGPSQQCGQACARQTARTRPSSRTTKSVPTLYKTWHSGSGGTLSKPVHH
jgi:hypothetical protein